jgi:hypothetical protein
MLINTLFLVNVLSCFLLFNYHKLLELQLRGHWLSYSGILLGVPTRCAYSEMSTRGVALPVSNKALGQ